MRHNLLAQLLCSFTAVVSQRIPRQKASAANVDEDIQGRCGTENPPEELMDITQWTLRDTSQDANREIEINTYFHVVESEDQRGSVTERMLIDQVRIRLYQYALALPLQPLLYRGTKCCQLLYSPIMATELSPIARLVHRPAIMLWWLTMAATDVYIL